jgi:hypothetical protein
MYCSLGLITVATVLGMAAGFFIAIMCVDISQYSMGQRVKRAVPSVKKTNDVTIEQVVTQPENYINE